MLKRYDTTTASLTAYLLRQGCNEVEFDAGVKIQALREVAIKLAAAADKGGQTLDPMDLSVIDVEVDSVNVIRLS